MCKQIRSIALAADGVIVEQADKEFTASMKEPVVFRLPSTYLKEDGALKNAITCIAVARDHLTCSPEVGHGANVRLTIKGTRYCGEGELVSQSFGLVFQSLPGLSIPKPVKLHSRSGSGGGLGRRRGGMRRQGQKRLPRQFALLRSTWSLLRRLL